MGEIEMIDHESKKNILRSILRTIEGANVTKVGQKVGTGLSKTLSAFGIVGIRVAITFIVVCARLNKSLFSVGFVRFLQGYYVVFVTKRRRAATVGWHTVYKIEEVKTVYVPADEGKDAHPDEAR